MIITRKTIRSIIREEMSMQLNEGITPVAKNIIKNAINSLETLVNKNNWINNPSQAIPKQSLKPIVMKLRMAGVKPYDILAAMKTTVAEDQKRWLTEESVTETESESLGFRPPIKGGGDGALNDLRKMIGGEEEAIDQALDDDEDNVPTPDNMGDYVGTPEIPEDEEATGEDTVTESLLRNLVSEIVKKKDCVDSKGKKGKYVLMTKDDDKQLGCHKTSSEVYAQEKAIEKNS